MNPDKGSPNRRKCSASSVTLVYCGRVVKERNCGNARRESDEPDNPADGYFEWQKTEDGKKIPNYLYSEKEPLLRFAGLYEWWAAPSLPVDDPGRWLLSCTVLTTTAQDALGHVHDRSPVIIPRDRFAEWLDPDLTDKNDIQHLLDSLPEPILVPRIVGTRVNSVRNNGPELIEPAAWLSRAPGPTPLATHLTPPPACKKHLLRRSTSYMKPASTANNKHACLFHCGVG